MTATCPHELRTGYCLICARAALVAIRHSLQEWAEQAECTRCTEAIVDCIARCNAAIGDE